MSPIGTSTAVTKLKILRQKCITDLSSFRAGGLKNKPFWTKYVQDPIIISMTQGLRISRINNDFPSVRPKITFSPFETNLIQLEIEALLQQNVIEQVQNSPQNEFISTIFLVPKPDSGNRVILNLKRFNEQVEKSHFKMNSLSSAIELMTPGSFMASVDFKSAYYSVPVCEEHRPYLRFVFNGIKYQYTCLPMGLTTGPRDFTKIIKVMFKFLRERGYTNTFYIDDSLLIEKTFERCVENVCSTIEVSRAAGFTVHPEKSVFFPSQEIKYLGFVLNSVTMTVSLTPQKCERITNKIRHILTLTRPRIQDVAECVGKLVATFPAIQYGRLFYRQLEIDKAQALKRSAGNFRSKMTLSQTSKQDLHWWLKNINSNTLIASRNPDFVLTTDASTFGFGGKTSHMRHAGQWSHSEQALHINQKELLAVKKCLDKLCTAYSACTINIQSDNTTTVTYINGMGGKKFKNVITSLKTYGSGLSNAIFGLPVVLFLEN